MRRVIFQEQDFYVCCSYDNLALPDYTCTGSRHTINTPYVHHFQGRCENHHRTKTDMHYNTGRTYKK
jgi:hypothetical protein